MLAAVKTPHIEILLRGNIAPRVLEVLRAEYGQNLHLANEDDEELVNVFETDWYRSVKAAMAPGDILRICRETRKLTQMELGRRLGGIARQQISNMENGIRPISLAMAKKLTHIFNVPAARFLDLRESEHTNMP
jgi:plasmid maintenance system antidote protein VapI